MTEQTGKVPILAIKVRHSEYELHVVYTCQQHQITKCETPTAPSCNLHANSRFPPSDHYRSLLRRRHLRRSRPYRRPPALQQRLAHYQTPVPGRLASPLRMLMPHRRHDHPPLRYAHRLPDRSHQPQSHRPLRRRRIGHHRPGHPATQDQLFRTLQLGLSDPELDHHLCRQVWLSLLLPKSRAAAAEYPPLLESCSCSHGGGVSFLADRWGHRLSP